MCLIRSLLHSIQASCFRLIKRDAGYIACSGMPVQIVTFSITPLHCVTYSYVCIRLDILVVILLKKFLAPIIYSIKLRMYPYCLY